MIKISRKTGLIVLASTETVTESLDRTYIMERLRYDLK